MGVDAYVKSEGNTVIDGYSLSYLTVCEVTCEYHLQAIHIGEAFGDK